MILSQKQLRIFHQIEIMIFLIFSYKLLVNCILCLTNHTNVRFTYFLFKIIISLNYTLDIPVPRAFEKFFKGKSFCITINTVFSFFTFKNFFSLKMR